MAPKRDLDSNNAESCFSVLYTKHLVKKKKTYHDGFMRIRGLGSALLLDEHGHVLASAKLAAKSLPLDPHSEGEPPLRHRDVSQGEEWPDSSGNVVHRTAVAIMVLILL